MSKFQRGRLFCSPMVTILDGGMGNELLRRSRKRTPMWSAQVLVDDPDLVVQTHLDYIEAGATVIITNSYSTVPSYLATGGLESSYVELTRLAGELARQAASESGTDVRIAGSLPPLSESYRPDLVPPDAEARPIYAEMAAALEPNVDIFLCETMSSAREGTNAVSQAKKAARGRELPVWVSWTLNEAEGKGLRSGETVKEAFEALAEFEPHAFLFNCTSSEAITQGIRELTALTDRPTGGYPNRYVVPEGWTLGQDVVNDVDASTEAFIKGAGAAIDAGASIYGGCCTVGPADIAALSRQLT